MTSTEKIQSAIAIFVAFLALFISVWQGCEQRKHNRLSVKPLLGFDNISMNNAKSIRISNNGLGPAIITSFSIKDEEKILNAIDENPWEYFLKARGIRDSISSMYYFSSGSIIQSGETFTLLQWRPTDQRVLNLEIEIQYKSIYEEEFSVKEDF